MIKLTELSDDGEGDPVYVKIDAILWFGAVDDHTRLSTPTFTFEVMETPEQIRILMYGRDSSGAIMDA